MYITKHASISDDVSTIRFITFYNLHCLAATAAATNATAPVVLIQWKDENYGRVTRTSSRTPIGISGYLIHTA